MADDSKDAEIYVFSFPHPACRVKPVTNIEVMSFTLAQESVMLSLKYKLVSSVGSSLQYDDVPLESQQVTF